MKCSDSIKIEGWPIRDSLEVVCCVLEDKLYPLGTKQVEPNPLSTERSIKLVYRRKTSRHD